MYKAIGSFQRWLKRKKGEIPFYRSDSWFKDLLRIIGLGIMIFFTKCRQLDCTYLVCECFKGDPRFLRTSRRAEHALLLAYCCPGLCLNSLFILCFFEVSFDLSAPGSVVPKSSRTEIEEPGRRQDPVTAERGHTAHKQAPLGVSKKRRGKKCFFFFFETSLLLVHLKLPLNSTWWAILPWLRLK